jgi:hypothetical protein
MDFLQVIVILLSDYWYLLLLFVLLVFLKTPLFKGWCGEFKVNFLAWLLLNKNKYHRINNVTLPSENGTTQIDHIIVSAYGVFVVETKNMKGWIFGSADQNTWTHIIFKYKNKFQNPLRQNYKHVKTLQSILDLEDNQVHSVVVFVGDSEFKTSMPDNVTHGVRYIKHIKSKKEKVLSEADVSEILNKIEKTRLSQSFVTSRKHIKNVRDIVRAKEKI